MRPSRFAALAVVASIGAATAATVHAHRLDEFLEAARVSLEPSQVDVEMNLTPGISTADRFIRAVDGNTDGVFSSIEQWNYATGLVRSLDVRIDDARVQPLRVTAVDVPDAASVRSGDAAATVRATVPIGALAPGVHRLVFRNDDGGSDSVFMANTVSPDSRIIAVTAQEHSVDQRELTIEFAVSGEAQTKAKWAWPTLLVLIAAGASLAWTARRTSREPVRLLSARRARVRVGTRGDNQEGHALSRSCERSADRFALELTRNPAAFVSAMRRLAAQNLAEEHPSILIQWLFYSHPPIRERIAAAEGFHGRSGLRRTQNS